MNPRQAKIQRKRAREARRQRIVRRRDEQNERRATIYESAGEAAPTEGVAVPDTLEEFLEHVYWPHIRDIDPITGGPAPVSTLNAMQSDYLDRRTAWRFDSETGQPLGGRDIVGKARQVRMTSLCFAAILYHMIRLQGTRYVTVFQIEDEKILGAAKDRIWFALERLSKSHPEWMYGQKMHKAIIGDRIRIGRSRWELVSAGATEAVASKIGRSGSIFGLHLTECREYAHPSALFAAASECVPESGWIVAESTFANDPDDWHATEYELTGRNEGSFHRRFFWPWYIDPIKRMRRGSVAYEAVMGPEFAEGIPPEELAREAELDLTDEQIAYRRSRYFRGTAAQRRLARAENPERDSDPFLYAGEIWLDAGALEQCADMARAPAWHTETIRGLVVRQFLAPGEIPPSEMLVLGVDTSSATWRDRSAVRCRTAVTLQPVFEVHGKAVADVLVDVLAIMVGRYVDLDDWGSYIVAIERNRGLEVLKKAARRGLSLFEEKRDKRRARGRSLSRVGLWNFAAKRDAMFACLAEAVEGPRDSEGATAAPSVEFRSAELVAQLYKLREKKGKVQGVGGHDDLVVAEAITLYVSRLYGYRRGGEILQIGDGSFPSLQRRPG